MKCEFVTAPRISAIALACIILTGPGNLLGQPATVTFDILASFDYPGSTKTETRGVNQRGDVSGYYYDSFGGSHGYARVRNGTFIAIDDPEGTNTLAYGINSSRTVVGSYFDQTEGVAHGFLLSGNIFTQFDAGGPGSTSIAGINDAGDFVGDRSYDTAYGFASIGGNTINITVPGAPGTVPEGINSSGEIAGWYFDSVFTIHAFIRDTTGVFRFPLDYPGASSTTAAGINDQRWIVGNYFNATGSHAFLFQPPNAFTSYDYPGATSTAFTGINNSGLLCGRYADGSGVHGFVARVRKSL